MTKAMRTDLQTDPRSNHQKAHGQVRPRKLAPHSPSSYDLAPRSLLIVGLVLALFMTSTVASGQVLGSADGQPTAGRQPSRLLAADTVTITAPEDGDYIDIDVFGPDIELLFDYTQQPGHTLIDIQLWVNGANTGFSCGWAGGEGSCYFTPSPSVCGTVLQIKALFVGLGAGTRFSNVIGVWTYGGSNTACLPNPPECTENSTGSNVGGPINLVSGNMFYRTQDATVPSPLPIQFIRRYDSQSTRSGIFGPGWRHSYELEQNCSSGFGNYCNFTTPSNQICFCGKDAQNNWHCLCLLYAYNGINTLTTPDKTRYVFIDVLGVKKLNFIEDRNGNRITLAYNPDGTLNTITDVFGRALTFAYTGGLVTSMTRPDGVAITYGYTSGKLSSVSYPDGVVTTYHYDDPVRVDNMSSIKDQYGHVLEAWTYDAANRATLFKQEDSPGGGPPVGQVTIAYDVPTPGQRRVIDALGNVATYTVDPVLKVVTAVVGSCENCAGRGVESQSFEWDTRQRLTRRTDARGLVTELIYDNSSRSKFGNIKQVIEAQGTPLERNTYFCYHPTYNYVTVMKTPSVGNCAIPDGTSCGPVTSDHKIVIRTYDSSNGNLLATERRGCTGDANGQVGQPFSYLTSNTYNSFGQLTSWDGPRTDVVDVKTFTYYAAPSPHKGFLYNVINALGHVVTDESYDDQGRVLSLLDENNVRTCYTYDPMLRIASTTVEGAVPAEDMVTEYNYDDHVGHLQSVTNPRGLTTNYTEDGAHRRTDSIDPMGNITHTEFDPMSRTTALELRDGPGAPDWKRSFDYDAFHRLSRTFYTVSTDPPQLVNIELGYDADGNLSQRTDANPDGHVIRYQYDALGRVTVVTRQLGSDPPVAVAAYTYDGQGNVATTTDATTMVTRQYWDDLHRLVRTESLDSGTSFHQYDAAGNTVRTMDANGIDTTQTFDELNRLTATHHPDPSHDIYNTFDSPSVSFGTGAMTGITDATGSAAYNYDRSGLLLTEERTSGTENGTTSYTYDKNGNVRTMTYPLSGRIVTYTYDDADRIESVSVTVNTLSQTLVSSIRYKPAGPRTAMTFSNGLVDSRSYDDSYQILAHTVTGVLDYTYTYDEDSLIAHVVDGIDSVNNRILDYDGAHRLTVASGPWGAGTYTYDNNGNRLSQDIGGAATAYTYAPLNLNRLESTAGAEPAIYRYDDAGMVTRKEGLVDHYGYVYDQRSQLTLASRIIGGIGPALTLGEYGYDADRRRVVKQLPNDLRAPTVTYYYDGSGKLLEETTSDELGFVGRKSYVWLDAEPIARIDNDGATDTVYYYHTDHNGTPLRMTDATPLVVWSAEFLPFGRLFLSPVATIENNLRFPGQYYDAETGLSQNWHRYYDAALGRYLQSDPSGLLDGPNLYTYAHGNPLTFIDPNGRQAAVAEPEVDVKKAPGNNTCTANPQECAEAAREILLRRPPPKQVLEVPKWYKWIARCLAGGTAVAVEGDTTPAQEPEQQPAPRTQPKSEPEPPPDNCAESRPDIIKCADLPSDYQYFSPTDALRDLKAVTGNNNLKLHKKDRPATSGPCAGRGGTHTQVMDRGEVKAAIVCCPCCDDGPGGAVPFTECAIVNVRE